MNFKAASTMCLPLLKTQRWMAGKHILGLMTSSNLLHTSQQPTGLKAFIGTTNSAELHHHVFQHFLCPLQIASPPRGGNQGVPGSCVWAHAGSLHVLKHLRGLLK